MQGCIVPIDHCFYLPVSIDYFFTVFIVMFIGRVPNILSTFGSLKCLSITILIQHSILLQNLVTFSHSRKAWTTVSSLLQNKYVDESAKFILRRILLVITLLCIILKCISLENVSNVNKKTHRKIGFNKLKLHIFIQFYGPMFLNIL